MSRVPSKMEKNLNLILQFCVNNSERTKTEEKAAVPAAAPLCLAAVKDHFTSALPYSPTLL